MLLLLASVVTVAAILERLWFPHAWGEAGSLTSVFYYGDATRFVDYALAIARGQAYDNGIPYHPPGWPLLLAAIFRFGGVAGSGAIPVGAIKALTAVLSGVSVGLAALMCGEIAGLGALLAFALLAPFDFGHIVEGSVANSEPLYGLLVVVAVWGAWRWLRDDARPRPGWAALAGAASGAATLVRAEFLLGAMIFAAYAMMRRARPRDVVAAIVMFCVVLTPTTLWHWRTLSAFDAAHAGRIAGPLPRFAPVTSYGPFNFAMANHENADGGPNRDHPMLDRCQGEAGTQLAAGQLDIACPAVYDLYVDGYAIGARWIAANPVEALALAGRKIAFTIGFLGDGFLADDLGVGVDGVRRRVDLVDPAHGWLIPVRLLLIVVGVVTLRRQPVALAIIAAALAALVGSVLLFYGYVRLGVAYIPIVYLLEAAAVARIAAALFRRVATYRTIYGVLAAIAIFVGYERSIRDVPRALAIAGAQRSDGSLIQDETLEIHRR